jgi:hypothetical protein
VQGRIDLLFDRLDAGDVAAAETAWPALWEAALGSRAFHQWLMGGRLLTARARIALAKGDAQAAAEFATESIASARQHHRLKYEVASRTVLGSALAQMGSKVEAAAELRTAVADAERLGHPPSRWRAAYELARTLQAVGDDAGAEAAALTACDTMGAFVESLADKHRDHFLAAPRVAEVLAFAS